MKTSYRIQRCLIGAGLIINLLALSPTLVPAQQQKPLKEKENPLLIGQRDINRHQINFYSLKREIAIGQRLCLEFERRAQLLDDPVVSEYINRLGQNIILHSDAVIPFTIKVVDSSEVNAFALPGGYLYVNTGLIMAAGNEAELAGVMAHEIAHVAARHGAEQVSKGRLLQYASLPLIFLGGIGGALAQAGASLATPLAFLKFSRGAEEEADRLGAEYLWTAGYDPEALLSFFEKLRTKEDDEMSTLERLFRTHPPTGKRASKVRKLLGRFPQREEYVIDSSEFQRIRQHLRRLIGITGRLSTGSRPVLKRERPTLDEQPTDGQGQPGAPTLSRKSRANED